MKFLLYGSIGLLCVAFCGCARNEFGCDEKATPGVVQTNAVTALWRNLSDSTPLVCVGNRVLRKGELIATYTNELQTLIARGESPQMAFQRIKKSRSTIITQAIARFVYESAFLCEAEARGLQPDSQKVAQQWQLVSNVSTKAGLTLERFAETSGHVTLERLGGFIEKQVLLRQTFDLLFSNRLDVAESEVEELHRSLLAKNEESAATNRIIKAEMDVLRTKIVAEDPHFTDDNEANEALVPEGYKVEWFENSPATAFDDDESFAYKLRYMTTNVWSEVIATSDEFNIYKLTAVEATHDGLPSLYTGFRIHREQDHGYLVPTKEKLRADLHERRNLAIVTPECARLQKKYGLLYPNGFVWETMFNSDMKKGSGYAK